MGFPRRRSLPRCEHSFALGRACPHTNIIGVGAWIERPAPLEAVGFLMGFNPKTFCLSAESSAQAGREIFWRECLWILPFSQDAKRPVFSF